MESQSGTSLATYHQRALYLAFANTRHTAKVLSTWLLTGTSLAAACTSYISVQLAREEQGAAQLQRRSSTAHLFCSERKSHSGGLLMLGLLIIT